MLYDLSIEDEEHGIALNIFRPLADMPDVSSTDIVVLTSVKVQRWRADPLSLLTHTSTSILVYSAPKIPKPPMSAETALKPSRKRDRHKPTAPENLYVSHFYHKIDKYAFPDEEEFRARTERSLNVKNKFSLLKDVQDGNFYDLIAQVARDPGGTYDIVTLYVSDYTENPNFHPQVWDGAKELGAGDGDAFGYTSGTAPATKEWVGPYGKMSIQITCYEPHASFIRDTVSAGQWVLLRNVQIKYGRNFKHLEGFLREDRGSVNTRINIQILETDDPDTVDPRLKEAIRRYRDYTKKKKQQIRELKSAQAAGLKRKASRAGEREPTTTKERRKASRAAEREEKEKRIEQEMRARLNERITCESHDTLFVTVGQVLEPTCYDTTIDGQSTALVMPFNCAKYMTRARVVDFFPSALEDFACSYKQTDFEVLSDYESNTDLNSSEDDEEDTCTARRVWEWRFALQLEDPAPPTGTAKSKSGPQPRLWVLVDNHEAQNLTGLDATDLHRNPDTLNTLRERMTTLWGNLEELKARNAEARRQKEDAARKQAGKARRGPEKPPLDDSDAEEGAGEEAVSNLPFGCCIQQYGVYDKEKATWVRCYGLFGTKIRA